MRIAQTQNTLTVWVFASDETRARWHTAAKFHGTSPRGEQSSTEAVAEVQMNNRWLVIWVRNRNNEGDVAASWRQRNLRSGWRVRQYDLTTSLRQRRRRAISQWIGVILYGFFRLGPQWAFPKRSAQCWVTYEREQTYIPLQHKTGSHWR